MEAHQTEIYVAKGSFRFIDDTLDDFSTCIQLRMLRGMDVLVASRADFQIPKSMLCRQFYRRQWKRCIVMTTDPGDLVLDPTCGCRYDGA